MKGTALIINKDQTVTVFENLNKEEIEKLHRKGKQIVFCEEAIDWNYGY